MKDERTNTGTDRAAGHEIGVSGTALGNHWSAPIWIELLPAGDFAGRDGRGPFRLSHPEAVITATDELRMDAGLPIDYDHATDFAAPVGRPAPAAGWIHQIEVRNGALWGEVEWTRHGAAAVVTHEYRYISPVFEYSADGEVQRLLRAALTNNPNLYLTAISARTDNGAISQSVTAGATRGGDAGARDDQEDAEMNDLAARLRELCGLGEDATAEEIVNEVRNLKQESAGGYRATAAAAQGGGANGETTADPARYVPIAQFENALTELNRIRATSARERASFRVDAAMKAGKIIPAQREWAITYCQANLRGFEDFVARQPAVIGLTAEGFTGEPAAARLSRNERDEPHRDRGRAAGALTRTELTVCARLGLRPEEYLRRRNFRGEFLTSNSD
jgi:phage I-like protein